MSGSLEFKIYEIDGVVCGGFTPKDSERWHVLTEQFDEKLDHYENGRLPHGAFITSCKEIIKTEPNYLDAYFHIGLVFSKLDSPSAATWYKKGFERAAAMIPSGFEGEITWSDLDNRPFLRCHHGYLLSLLHKRKTKQAILEAERHLSWNPNDNLGVRYLLGELYLLAKNLKAAQDIMLKNADTYPPYYYSLGLIEFLQKNYVQAVTCFRKGILSNPYMAEILTGRFTIITHKFWHGSSNMSPDLVIDFMQSIGDQLWQKHENAKEFLDWVFNCSMVLKERSEYTECLEQLQSEHDFNKRGEIGKVHEQIFANINDDTSKPLVKKIKTRDTVCWPWETDGWRSFGF